MSAPASALRFLLTRSLVNGVLFRLRRLRQPKYLLGAILGVAYFYIYFGKILGASRQPIGPQGFSRITLGPELGAALLFLTTVALAWILPASRAAIAFTEAEIAFLFPAPIPRRTLVIVRLLKSQLSLLFFSVFIMLLASGFHVTAEGWFRVGGWWVILNTLNLHRIGASFALQRLRERGMADGKRRAVVALVLLGIVVAAEWMRRSLPDAPSFGAVMQGGGKALADFVAQVLQARPLPYVLAPFKLVVLPNFAHDAGSFLRALGPALAIMALHFLWVVRADVSFEDAAIESAKKRAAFLAARGRGESRARSGPLQPRTPVWRLRPTGFAPVAFVWKSLLKAGGKRTLSRWSLFFLGLAAGARALGQVHEPSRALTILAAIIGICCYVTLLLSFILIGQHAAAQLRQGIAAMDLLKSYPIPGWQIALGELAGPVLLGTGMQWFALGTSLLLLKMLPALAPAATMLWYLGIALALFLPIFNLSCAVLPAAGALYFPGWFRPQENTGPGIESTGLRLLLGISQLLAIVAALIPAALFGAIAWSAAGKFTTEIDWRALAAASTAIAILAMEAGLGVAWLGSLYDQFDLTHE